MLKVKISRNVEEIEGEVEFEELLNQFAKKKKAVDKINADLKELKQKIEEKGWDYLAEQKSAVFITDTVNVKFAVSEKLVIKNPPELRKRLGDDFDAFVTTGFTAKSGLRNLVIFNKDLSPLVHVLKPTASITLV